MTVGPKNATKKQQRTKKQKKNKSQKRRRTKSSVQNLAMSRKLHVHPCTVAFAKALADPWTFYRSNGCVCLPDDLDLPSWKLGVRYRGSLTTGTIGFGCVVLSPFAFWNQNVNSILSINSTYPGIVIPGSAGAGISLNTSNSPIDSAGGNIWNMRCVVAGLRARYTGTELSRGGQLIPYRSTIISGTADNCSGNSLNDIASLNRAELQPNDRQWVGTVWTPNDAAYRAFQPIAPNSYALGGGVSLGYNLSVVMQGAPANTYEFDCVAFYEFVSSDNNQVPNVTASDADVEGYSFLRDVYAKMSDSDMGQIVWSKILAEAGSYVKSSVTFPSLLY